jgi:hypothetical protein
MSQPESAIWQSSRDCRPSAAPKLKAGLACPLAAAATLRINVKSSGLLIAANFSGFRLKVTLLFLFS